MMSYVGLFTASAYIIYIPWESAEVSRVVMVDVSRQRQFYPGVSWNT